MRIDDFIWLDQFVEKIEVKHDVFPEEVEEVFLNRPRIKRIRRGKVHREDLYRAFGQTMNGRYLSVYFIYKPAVRKALVISARDMDKKERKSYGRR